MNSPSQHQIALTYSQHSIITSRVTIPKQAPFYVQRTRLMSRFLDENRAKVTLIAASAGFGKTTLAAEWARIHADEVAWLSLDISDNHLVRFWLSVHAAIQRIASSFLSRLDLFLQSVRDGSVETAISLLLNELYSLPSVITLIVDDYHTITNQSVHESMGFFIGHLPDHVKLVILSRTRPPLSLSRLRVQQELLELSNDDLRFTFEEINELQSQSLRDQLTLEELLLLEQKTEGWVAGLILAFLSFSEKQDRTAYMNTFSGNSRNIFDYLLDEVLSRQSTEVQNFLLVTSILNSFSPSLAAAVMDQSGAEKQLHEVEEARLFIVPLDDTRSWFRYHHLFAEMLKTRLSKKMSSAEIVNLHRRAAIWYDQEGLALEAIQHAFEAKDYVLSASCMDRHFNSIIKNGDESILLDLLDMLPIKNMIVHPDLFYFQAGSMAVSGRTDDAKRFLHKVERFMEEEFFIPEKEQVVVQMQLDLYRASIAFYQGDVDTFVELLDQNREGIERFSSIVKVVNVGEALLFRGPIGFGGRLKKMAYLSAKVSTSEERRALIHFALQGHGFIFLSDLFYEWNRLDDASLQVEKALVMCSSSEQVSVWVPGVILQSKILKALGHIEEAAVVLRMAIKELKQHHSPRWERLLEAAHIRILLSQGLVNSGDEWLAKSHISTTDKPNVTREYEQITLAHILMARQAFNEAIPWLNKLLSEARRTDRMGSQIEILLLLAVSYEILSKNSQAFEALEQALKLAEPEGYIRIFLDEGVPLTRMLQRYLSERSTTSDVDYVHQLLQSYQLEPLYNDTSKAMRTSDSSIAFHFTKRELELMFFIVEGLSNDEIASRLFLSPGTVKRYIHNIYQKLDVKNRVQAVSKIREHQLL
ncbi:LuxR C-terminal-related transcriptional regulator [Paenibacillus sp. B-A-8]|uniref:LuxR C-terminal-related transcriptional regulator n=1 Tax=Paenibacillus sp. B-A-8 TaxID=3400419 RepID=UPI003B019C87